jgi:hypothetical protein
MKSNFDSPRPRKISRREFLTTAAAAGLLAACSPAQSAPTPTSAPPPPTATSAAPPPTATNAAPPPTATSASAPAPTAVPAPAAASSVPRPDIIKFYPAVTSKVIRASHSGVWSGETLEPKAIRQMLDASITKLTGLNDAKEAWLALFKPTEKIAIKVNAFRNSVIFTHVPLVTAVTDSLVEAGIPAEQIVVFDFWTTELETAGFTINQDGPGVRCYGTENNYTKGFKVNKVNTQLSNILLNSDALINIPVLKSHMISGISFAMKNHYGTVPNPESLHSVGACIPGLNALPEIKDRTRLIIGDVLQANLKYGYSWPYWKADYTGDSILMSFDPVAHDTAGFQILSQLVTESGENPQALTAMAKPCLEGAAKAGLGAYDPANFELTEVKVG